MYADRKWSGRQPHGMEDHPAILPGTHGGGRFGERYHYQYDDRQIVEQCLDALSRNIQFIPTTGIPFTRPRRNIVVTVVLR
jgi:hypothetical protein